MRRGITREKTTKLIQDIRNIIPDIAIRITLIAGYPGETEADFQEMQIAEEMQFERFRYFHLFPAKKTLHAYNFEDDVPQKIKKEKELMPSWNFSPNFLRTEPARIKPFKVLIDRAEGDYFIEE